jgi:hypothetical protein
MTQSKNFIRADNSFRHFDPEGYSVMDNLIEQAAQGNDGAFKELLHIARPRFEKTAARILYKYSGHKAEQYEIEDVIDYALTGSEGDGGILGELKQGSISGWNDFNREFLRRADTYATNHSKRIRPLQLTRQQTHAMPEREPRLDSMEYCELQDVLAKEMTALTPPQQAALTMKMQGHTWLDVADALGCKDTSAIHHYGKGAEQLSHSQRLADYVDAEVVPAPEKHVRAHTIYPSIAPDLSAIDQKIIAQKKVLRSYLCDDEGKLDRKSVAQEAGMEEKAVKTLTDSNPGSVSTLSHLLSQPYLQGKTDGADYGALVRVVKKQGGTNEDMERFVEATEELRKLVKEKRELGFTTPELNGIPLHR